VLPVEAPNGLDPGAAGLFPPPNSGVDDCCEPEFAVPNIPPDAPDGAPNGEALLPPDDAGCPPKLKGDVMMRELC
jgi:hypothetical protein